MIKSNWKVKTNDLIGYSKAASMASFVTTIFANPFKVVNTKMIMRTREKEGSDRENSNKSYGTLDCVKEIWRNDGALGFFRGIGPSLFLIINPIIQYVIYEFLKNEIKGRNTTNISFYSKKPYYFLNAFLYSYRYKKISRAMDFYHRGNLQSHRYHVYLSLSSDKNTFSC
jgi:hypothetical protein